MKCTLYLGTLLLLLASGGCGSANHAPNPPAATPSTTTAAEASDSGADAVRLSIVNFDEIQSHVARQHGKVVVMDAWSTSCPPCMREFPHLVALHKEYSAQDLACISLSFDYEGLGTPEDQQAPVLEFLRRQGATFDNLLSNEDSDTLYKKFHLAAVPAVFVYDRTGKLRKRFDNEQAKSQQEAFTYEQVGQLVAELVKEPAPEN